MRVSSASRVLALLSPLLLSQFLLVGQDSGKSEPSNQSSGPVVFKSSVNRVIVDVVVTDSNGKPVPGLTLADFSVKEDGQPQSVLSFDVHDFDSNSVVVAKLPPLPPNTFVNIATAPERGPLYVLLLDLVNTEMDDQAFARKQLLNFVKAKPEGTRFAVFCLADGLHLVQGFTSDRDQLYRVLDPSTPKSHIPRLFLFASNFGRQGDPDLKGDPALTASVLTDIARYLDGLPGRKNVIWFSGNFPMQLFPSENDFLPNMREIELKALDALTRSEASVYPINVRGVIPNPEGALTGGNPKGGAQTVSLAPGQVQTNFGASGMTNSMRDAGHGGSVLSDYEVQDEVASLTGGHAFYSTNDLKEALDQATDMGAHYYTLTYSPTNTKYDGKLRNIRVELAKKGYHLEYRRVYYGNGPQSPLIAITPKIPGERAERPIGDSLSANMQRGAPVARQIFFRAHVQAVGVPALGTPEQMANLAEQPAYFRKRKKDKPAKPLAPVELQTYVVDYTVVGRQPNLEIAAAVYDFDGTMLNGDVENASSVSPTSGPAKGGTYYRIQQRIDVPVKAKTMRLAVRDMATDHIGALEFELPLQAEPAQAALPATTTGQPSKPN